MRNTILCAILPLLAPHVADAHCWHNLESGLTNFSDPVTACKDYIAKKYPNDTGWTARINTTADSYTFGCTQVESDGDEFYIGTVTATPAQEHCYEMVSGPYRNTNTGYGLVFPGANYQTSQRDAIKSANWAKCNPGLGGNYGSDFAGRAVQALLYGWIGEVEPCQVLSNLAPARGEPDCRPQVHHFIPKKDENGCGCGANSRGNALLVSAYINNKMSNQPPPQALVDYVNSMSATTCHP